MVQRFKVEADEAGLRLDVFVSKRSDGVGRALAKQLCADGNVSINGRRAKKSFLLSAGDEVCVERDQSPEKEIVADQAVELNVVKEMSDYVVVHKPSGIPTHPLKDGEKGTLCNALVVRYPEMQGVGYSCREPGILHRLDNDTSGLVLAARSTTAFDSLRFALSEGGIEKHYVALCRGRVLERTIFDAPIGNDPKDARKSTACYGEIEADRFKAKAALTEVITSETKGNYSLVKVRANKARRHQVRVHLSAAGHPLVGDTLYGGDSVEGLEGQFLHASALSFDEPSSGKRVDVSVALPPRLQRVLDELSR